MDDILKNELAKISERLDNIENRKLDLREKLLIPIIISFITALSTLVLWSIQFNKSDKISKQQQKVELLTDLSTDLSKLLNSYNSKVAVQIELASLIDENYKGTDQETFILLDSIKKNASLYL